MHERTIAKNLLNVVLDKATIHGKKNKIELIRIVVGEFTMIHDELLVDTFYQLSQSTMAEGARIEIIPTLLRGQCQGCLKEFYINKKSFQCPYCGNQSIQVVSGDELFVQDIELSENNFLC